ncbi:hypothetical protein, partial [Sinorhizobium meliloti]|uniref:hypothetical protein n=1 Tax=Rhizobium meliloti TaxID=382 RepID=UPI001AECFE64
FLCSHERARRLSSANACFVRVVLTASGGKKPTLNRDPAEKFRKAPCFRTVTRSAEILARPQEPGGGGAVSAIHPLFKMTVV